MDKKKLPRVLIVSRGVWDDTRGTSSTLSNLFSDYPADKLSMIYTETKLPNTNKCSRFFQISEFALVKKMVIWSTKTGHEVVSSSILPREVLQDARREEMALGFVRKHRSIAFTVLRDCLWALGTWKSSELKQFIQDSNPDVIWFDGATNVFLNKLYHYVFKVAQKPSAIFLMDDNYTYKSVIKGHYLYRFFMRLSAKRVIEECTKVFVISPKMKEEFDTIFGIDSVILTKGIDFSDYKYAPSPTHQPIRLLYMGQILYGRIDTLLKVVEALEKINRDAIRIKLSIYTNNYIKPKDQALLTNSASVELMAPVPYDQVPKVIAENDVLLFAESLNPKYNKDIRLSFSTKITDYLASGKCIFAVGPEDSAPMDYFKREDCAIQACEEDGIEAALEMLLDDEIVSLYSKRAFDVGRKNHNKQLVNSRLFNGLSEIVS